MKMLEMVPKARYVTLKALLVVRQLPPLPLVWRQLLHVPKLGYAQPWHSKQRRFQKQCPWMPLCRLECRYWHHSAAHSPHPLHRTQMASSL
jgi:hypothetical protein